jgi:hypothetical protein
MRACFNPDDRLERRLFEGDFKMPFRSGVYCQEAKLEPFIYWTRVSRRGVSLPT